MKKVDEDQVGVTTGMVRLWLLEQGLLGKQSTAFALQQLSMEILRDVAITGDAPEPKKLPIQAFYPLIA